MEGVVEAGVGGVVEGVGVEDGAPAVADGAAFAVEAGGGIGGGVGAAGGGFVVSELGEGGPEDAVAGGAEAEAKVEVVEGDGEVFGV